MPTPQIVQKLLVAAETTFGIDLTGSLASFRPVPFMEGSASWAPNQDTHNPLQALQAQLDYQKEILGKKHWEMSFNLPFAPTGVAAAAGTPAPSNSALDLILRTCMGGVFRGEGSVVATGGWASAGGGDVADASGFRAGGIAGMVHNGQLHLRPIKQVSGDTLSVKPRFPAAPSQGAAIVSGATYFWTSDPQGSLQFAVQGENPEDRWVLMGGQGTFTPELALDGSIQSLNFTFTGVDWERAEDAAGTASLFNTALTQATYLSHEPIVGHQGECLIRTNGNIALTGAVAHISSIAFEGGLQYQQIPSPSGVQGVLRHRLIRPPGQAPVSGTFQTFYESNSRQKDKEARRDLAVFYRNGTSAGHAVAMEAPTVQYVNVQREDLDNIAGSTVEWRGRADRDVVIPSAATADAIAMASSPWRLHTA